MYYKRTIQPYEQVRNLTARETAKKAMNKRYFAFEDIPNDAPMMNARLSLAT